MLGTDDASPTEPAGARRLPGNVDEPVDPSAWRDLNRAWWDERVPIHVASELYDEAAFRRGRDSIEPWEVELLGDVDGLRLLHLQCHFGHDTMSWARHGASVVGLDFSSVAVAEATALAADLDLDARFVCSDLYDAVDALDGERFDVVYTGFGALNWLPDLARWGEVVAALLRPGGRLLLDEFHPVTWVFGDDDLTVEHDYFETEPFAWDESGSYANEGRATEHNRTIEHQHTVATILTSILDAGLRVTSFREYEHTRFRRWPFLEGGPDGTFRVPAGHPRLPLVLSVLAELPDADQVVFAEREPLC